MEHVVHGEFTPNHKLLEIGGAVLCIPLLRGIDGERDRDGRDLPVMEVGAHMRGGTRLGLAPDGGVMRERTGEIVRQPAFGLSLSALEPL